MSDDFDKNNPLWDDDEEETPGDDQDERFDWQADEDESQPAEQNRLGFTGELPWRGEDDEGDEPGQRPNRLGMTGELPWLQDQGDDAPGSGDDDDLLPWQRDAARRVEMETGDLSTPPVDDPPDADTDQPWSGRHVTADLDVPDWMRDTGPDFDSPHPDDEDTPTPPAPHQRDTDEPADEIETEVPDWMLDQSASGGEEYDEEAGDDEPLPVPDWLTGDDPLDQLSQPSAQDESPAPPLRDPAEDAPDWLQKIDTSHFGSGDDEPLPVPDWLQDDDDSPPVAEDDPLAEVPDWLTAEEPEPEPEEVFDPYDTSFGLDDDLPPTGSLPQTGEVDFDFDEWQADDSAEEESLGWLQEVEAEAAPQTDDALAWLDDDLLAEEAVDPDPTQPSDPTGPLVDRTTEEAPDEEASSELEDYFSVVEVEELPPMDAEVMAEEQPPEPVALDDDFFADLGTDDSITEPADDDADEFELAESADYGDDFFAALETIESTDDIPEPDFADFGIDEGEAAPPPEPVHPAPAPLDDDFFASLGIDTGDEAEEAPAEPDFEALFTEDVSDEDEAPAVFDADQIPDGEFLSSLGIRDEEDEAPVDWFAEDESAAEPEANWLDDLGDLPEPTAESTDEAAQLQADFLASLDDMDFAEAAQDTAAPAESYGDIDSILAAMDTEEAHLPDSSELVDPYADFDTLLTDPAFADVQPSQQQERPATPQDDWLTEMGATVGVTSAAALVRQQQDRPLDDLPERLRRLRDRAEETAATPRPEAESDVLDNLLPGVSNALTPGVFEVDATGIASAITITPDQQRRVDLLRSLAASEASVERPTRSAIDATYDADLLDDDAFADLLGEDADAAPQPVDALPVAAPRERRRIRIDQLLISLLLAAAVIVPFFVDTARIGQPPPRQFRAGQRRRSRLRCD